MERHRSEEAYGVGVAAAAAAFATCSRSTQLKGLADGRAARCGQQMLRALLF